MYVCTYVCVWDIHLFMFVCRFRKALQTLYVCLCMCMCVCVSYAYLYACVTMLIACISICISIDCSTRAAANKFVIFVENCDVWDNYLCMTVGHGGGGRVGVYVAGVEGFGLRRQRGVFSFCSAQFSLLWACLFL